MSLPEGNSAPGIHDLISGGFAPSGPSPPAAPPSQSVHVAVPRPRVPGDAVRNRGGEPVGEVDGESSGLRPGAGGSGEPELLDLRLHAPWPGVVIVRVSGPVRGPAVGVLADRVGKQLCRAPHVVLDLAEVSVLDSRGLTVLSTLHQQAMAWGTQLHIVGVEHEAVRQALHTTGGTPLLSLESTADAVIAALPGPVISGASALAASGPDPLRSRPPA